MLFLNGQQPGSCSECQKIVYEGGCVDVCRIPQRKSCRGTLPSAPLLVATLKASLLKDVSVQVSIWTSRKIAVTCGDIMWSRDWWDYFSLTLEDVSRELVDVGLIRSAASSASDFAQRCMLKVQQQYAAHSLIIVQMCCCMYAFSLKSPLMFAGVEAILTFNSFLFLLNQYFLVKRYFHLKWQISWIIWVAVTYGFWE